MNQTIVCLLQSLYICFNMHIKAFLKKITDMPSNDPIQSSRVSLTPKKNSQYKYRASFAAFSDKMITSAIKNSSSTINYLNNHHPILKLRLNGQRGKSISPDVTVQTKFRERIQERLMDLMNQRKQLVVTHTRTRKESSGSVHYSSAREKIKERNKQLIPEYAQNMYNQGIHSMRPCKVTSIPIGTRPKTGSLTISKSQPKIYCKSLLPSRQRRRMSTVDISKGKRRRITLNSKDWDKKKIDLVSEGRLDGWNRSKQRQQQEFVWFK